MTDLSYYYWHYSSRCSLELTYTYRFILTFTPADLLHFKTNYRSRCLQFTEVLDSDITIEKTIINMISFFRVVFSIGHLTYQDSLSIFTTFNYRNKVIFNSPNWNIIWKGKLPEMTEFTKYFIWIWLILKNWYTFYKIITYIMWLQKNLIINAII